MKYMICYLGMGNALVQLQTSAAIDNLFDSEKKAAAWLSEQDFGASSHQDGVFLIVPVARAMTAVRGTFPKH